LHFNEYINVKSYIYWVSFVIPFKTKNNDYSTFYYKTGEY